MPIVPLQENCQVSTAEYLYSDGILNWETASPSLFPPPCLSMNKQNWLDQDPAIYSTAVIYTLDRKPMDIRFKNSIQLCIQVICLGYQIC